MAAFGAFTASRVSKGKWWNMWKMVDTDFPPDFPDFHRETNMLSHRSGFWLLLVVCLLLGSVPFASSTHNARKMHFTQAQCDRIRIGMTRTEVQAILGPPPGNYLTRPGGLPPNSLSSVAAWEFWISDEGAVGVLFDSDRVVETAFCEVALD